MRVVVALLAATGALGLVPAASAQSADDLMRWLRPWVERQVFGDRAAEEEPAEDEAPAEDAAASGEAAAPDSMPAADEDAAGAGAAETDAVDGAAAADDSGATADASDREPAQEADGTVTGAVEPTGELAPAPQEERPLPLRFAVIAGASVSDTMAAVAPIAEEISAIVGRPVEFLPMATYGAMIDAQVERRVDGGFFTASAFAFAESRCRCLDPLVAPRATDGTFAYYAIIVARNGSGIESALDLEGRTVAIGAADSLGARRMQLAGLMASGLDLASFFGGVIEAGSAMDAVRLVREGRADAAFAWSSLEGAPDVAGGAAGRYSRGTLSRLAAAGEIVMDRYAIVWRSAPITHGPFAVLETLSEEEKDRISSFFVALEAARPATYDLLNPFYGGGYAPVDPQDYSGLSALTAHNVDALDLPLVAASRLPASADTPPRAEQ